MVYATLFIRRFLYVMRAQSLKRKAAKQARKQRERQKRESREKTKTVIGRAVAGSVVVLGILGSLATLHGYKARLSISPDNTPITSNNLSMPIKVSNDGILSVHDVRFACRYKKVVTDTGSEMTDAFIT